MAPDESLQSNVPRASRKPKGVRLHTQPHVTGFPVAASLISISDALSAARGSLKQNQMGVVGVGDVGAVTPA